MPLEEYAVSADLVVELCAHCRGIFVDAHEVPVLLGRGSVASVTEDVPLELGAPAAMTCPKCVDPAMQPLALRRDANDASPEERLWMCRDCRGLWLGDGAFLKLRRALAAGGSTRARPVPMGSSPSRRAKRDPTRPTPTAQPRAGLAYSRSQFDQGLENLIGMPLVLTLSFLFCATTFGRMLASLVGMPFHEVGHAAASWLSSRIALPLPFFTFWFDDQSWLMGGVVAASLLWLGYHSYQEGQRFGLITAAVLLTTQAVLTLVVPARLTLMGQILSGALGELLFGAFLLIAFHFPLPDRTRWDFWRWIAIVPGALCFAHAILLWRTASSDLAKMPWGAAIGNESDGDMNRLVREFGWTARELTDFYVTVGYLCCGALALTYLYAVYRQRRKAALVAEPLVTAS